MENLGKIIIGVGLVLVIVGLVIWVFGGRLGWFGHLPGDIRVERENFRFYAPITSMIILSIVLSIALSVIRRFFG
jgi:multisubunit Na+/H+ antiporter MnhC subunit